MVKGLKCAGVRVKSGVFQTCESKAKPQFRYFCTAEHQQQAEQFAAKAIEEYVSYACRAYTNAHLTEEHNQKLRKGLYKTILGGMEADTASFIIQGQKQLAEHIQTAWSGASSAYDSEDLQETTTSIQKAREQRENIKSKKRQLVAFDSSPEIEDVKPVAKKEKKRRTARRAVYDISEATTSDDTENTTGRKTVKQLVKMFNKPAPKAPPAEPVAQAQAVAPPVIPPEITDADMVKIRELEKDLQHAVNAPLPASQETMDWDE